MGEIKERKLLNKMKDLNYKLIERLNLSDKDDANFTEQFARYHNSINKAILALEIKAGKYK